MLHKFFIKIEEWKMTQTCFSSNSSIFWKFIFRFCTSFILLVEQENVSSRKGENNLNLIKFKSIYVERIKIFKKTVFSF